jgi:hypothetical protein
MIILFVCSFYSFQTNYSVENFFYNSSVLTCLGTGLPPTMESRQGWLLSRLPGLLTSTDCDLLVSKQSRYIGLLSSVKGHFHEIINLKVFMNRVLLSSRLPHFSSFRCFRKFAENFAMFRLFIYL